MENHSEELQGDQLVLKKEEAYLNMLKRRGSYLSKHLSKLESDFLRKYSNRTDTERQFLPDVKIMFDIYEVLVSEILCDLEFTELEEFGQGIQKLFQQIIMIINYLIQRVFNLVVGRDSAATTPSGNKSFDQQGHSRAPSNTPSEAQKTEQQKLKQHYEENERMLFALREETRLLEQQDSYDDELSRMQEDVLRNKNECLRIKESQLESNLKEAYDNLTQHSAHSKGFLDRAERRFKEVSSDIANFEFNKDAFFREEAQVYEKIHNRAKVVCSNIGQFKNLNWMDVAVQTEAQQSHGLRRSTNTNGTMDLRSHRKNIDSLDKYKMENLTLAAEVQALKKSLREEQERFEQCERDLQRQKQVNEKLQEEISEYKECVKHRQATIRELKEEHRPPAIKLDKRVKPAIDRIHWLANQATGGPVERPLSPNPRTPIKPRQEIEAEPQLNRESLYKRQARGSYHITFADQASLNQQQTQEKLDPRPEPTPPSSQTCSKVSFKIDIPEKETPFIQLEEAIPKLRKLRTEHRIRSRENLNTMLFGPAEMIERATSTTDIPTVSEQPLVASNISPPDTGKPELDCSKDFGLPSDTQRKSPKGNAVTLAVISEEDRIEDFLGASPPHSTSTLLKKQPSLRCMESNPANPSTEAKQNIAQISCRKESERKLAADFAIQTPDQEVMYRISRNKLKEIVLCSNELQLVEEMLVGIEALDATIIAKFIRVLKEEHRTTSQRLSQKQKPRLLRHLQSMKPLKALPLKNGLSQVEVSEVAIQCTIKLKADGSVDADCWSEEHQSLDVIALHYPQPVKSAYKRLEASSISDATNLQHMYSRFKQQRETHFPQHPLPIDSCGSFVNLLPEDQSSSKQTLRRANTSTRRHRNSNTALGNSSSRARLTADIYRKMSDNRKHNYGQFESVVAALNLPKSALRTLLSYDEFSLTVSKYFDRHRNCQPTVPLCRHILGLLQ